MGSRIIKNWGKLITIGSQDNNGHASDRQCIGARFFDFFNNCQSIVDIGCGCGCAVVELEKLGKDAFGVTINKKESEIMTARGINHLLEDIHDTTIASESKDGAIMWDVIEHSPSPDILMMEINRILKIGGKILAYIPSQDWISRDYHLNVLNIKQAEYLFSRNGFRVDEIITEPQMGEGAAVYKLIKIKNL
jgi:2-polyprenyl-3-methyl-5-hydroxy-6-metoxy-1,4-benzoquinol methylase